MADSLKNLGQAAPAAATDTDLYAAPSTAQTVISTLFVCNRSGSTTFRVWVAVAAASTSDEQYLYHDAPLDAHQTIAITAGITLNGTDVIRVRSASGSVSFNAFGSEITA